MVMVMMILLLMMIIKTSEEWKRNNRLYNFSSGSVTGTCTSINAFSIVNKSQAVIFHDFIHH